MGSGFILVLLPIMSNIIAPTQRVCPPPLNIQPVVIVRGLKRQQAAALTNFVGCFLLVLSNLFFLLLLSALNDLIGPSAGPLARTTYSIPESLPRKGR